MPLNYGFPFGPDYAGKSAVVRDASGATVAGSPITLDSHGIGTISLDEGAYQATTSNPNLNLNNAVVDGVLNLPHTVDTFSGGVGASETAHFIATGSGVTDTNLTPVTTLVADPAYTLPDWISLDGATLTIEEAMTLMGSSVASFSATFPTDVPDDPDGYAAYYCDAFTSVTPMTAFWGTDYLVNGAAQPSFESTTAPLNSSLYFANAGISLNFKTYGDAAQGAEFTPIPDGTYEMTVYIAITKILAAATLPA